MKTLRKVVIMILFVWMLAGCVGEATTFTVKFNTNGGTPVADVVLEKNKEVKLPTPPTKDGYEFGGWYTEESLDNLYLDGTLLKNNVTLYAKWLKVCEVSFVTNFEATLDSVKVTEGESISAPTISREGFSLVGWFTDPDLTTAYQFGSTVANDLTIYAKWVDTSTTYTVKFYVNGELTETQYVTTGNKATEVSVDVANYEARGWYTEPELTNAFDFSNPVNSDLELYVRLVQNTFVLEVKENANYTEFKAKKSDPTDDQTTFKLRKVSFLAGDDNALVLTPLVLLGTDYDADADEFGREYYGEWMFAYELYELVGEDFVLVNDPAVYVEQFDKVAASIDFNSDAVGKTFKVVVYPELLTVLQERSEYEIAYEVSVVDGLNVYKALDLAYIDTSNGVHYFDEQNNNAWATFKAEKGIDTTYHPAAVILQADIEITTNDIPSGMVYNSDEVLPSDSDYERALGSLKDHATLYYYYVEENQEFHIYGNLFNINVESIPEVIRENGNITPEGTTISHAQLFFIDGAANTKSTIENISILGNAPKVENAQKAGGLIFAKVNATDHEIKNVISSGFFITFMVNRSQAPYVVESCKAYDAYNCFIYNWGGPYVTVRNSDFVGAGGPIIIQDHVSPTEEDNSIGKCTFENCVLESFVNGQEGWFNVVGATAMVPVIKQLDGVFNAANRSFLKTQGQGSDTYTYMNLISVNKSGSAQSITAEKIKGYIKIDNGTPFDFGESNPYLAGLLDQTFQLGAPVFQGDTAGLTTGYAFFDGTTLRDVQGNVLSEYSLFASHYFCIYYNGMCFTFELFNMGETL